MNSHIEIILTYPLSRKFRQQFVTMSWFTCAKIATKIDLSKEPMDERWQHFLFEQYSVHCVTSDSINTNSTRCHEMERNAMKLSCPYQIVSIFDEIFMCFKKINAYSSGLLRE